VEHESSKKVAERSNSAHTGHSYMTQNWRYVRIGDNPGATQDSVGTLTLPRGPRSFTRRPRGILLCAIIPLHPIRAQTLRSTPNLSVDCYLGRITFTAMSDSVLMRIG